MSGIVGLYNRDGQPCQLEQLQGMTDAIAHRGPDGCELWCNDNIGFGHRMLLTTPESLVETLPLVEQEENHRFILTADARIDNREELLQELQLTSCTEQPITDSQIILAAYKRWDTACPEHLIGDFSFALWDEKRQQLFCSRDHFGVKPFYYHLSDSAFIFASELKAILTVSDVPHTINWRRIGDFLSMNLDDVVNTTYQNVLRLPPAHWLTINDNGVHIKRYWQLDPDYELLLESDEAYAERFRSLFEEAVRCRLRSAFPIGSQLSGGLDSSSVTTMARSLLVKEKSLHTFSYLFDDLPSCDERTYIEAVLEQGGMIPHYLRGDRLGPLSDIDAILDHEDEALPGPNYYFPWHLNKFAAQVGMRILLDGHDGDTVVSHGLYRLTELARAHQWEELVAEAKASANRLEFSAERELFAHAEPTLRRLSQQLQWLPLFKACRIFHQDLGLSRKRLLWQVGLRPLLQFWKAKLLGFPQNVSVRTEALLTPDFAEQLQAQRQAVQKTTSTKSLNQQPTTVRQQHWQSLNVGGFTYILEQIDRSAATFGIESRHPFLDKRLVEFCLALPSNQKMSQGWGRLIMRRAMIGLLPHKIQWRGNKANLTPNFSHGLLQINRPILECTIDFLSCAKAFINIEHVRDAYCKLISQQKMISSERMTLWQGIAFTSWLRHHPRKHAAILDAPPVSSPQAESGASFIEPITDNLLEMMKT